MTPYSRALAEAEAEARATGRAAVREYDDEAGHHWLSVNGAYVTIRHPGPPKWSADGQRVVVPWAHLTRLPDGGYVG